ncbi:MAG: hypothetical protein M1834_008885 [Cirrosporium novae-zelandiae]|nr:MAG: hypothetical protein M1834_008885 [Cirrosporium novae-zelandiae]
MSTTSDSTITISTTSSDTSTITSTMSDSSTTTLTVSDSITTTSATSDSSTITSTTSNSITNTPITSDLITTTSATLLDSSTTTSTTSTTSTSTICTAPICTPSTYTPRYGSYAYIQFYMGSHRTENPNNPGNSGEPPRTNNLPGNLNACDAIQACADLALNDPYTYYHFDLHFLTSQSEWVCVQYFNVNEDAGYFDVVNEDVREGYGYSLEFE